MKKTFLFAAFAALCMTSCMNEEFPTLTPTTSGYGYISVNVSNDVEMQTRATQTVESSELSKWTLIAYDGEIPYNLNEVGGKVPSGTYEVTASSHPSEEGIYVENEWGAPYYSGTAENAVSVEAGKTQTISINCGKAKNARLKVSFALNDNFTDCVLTADRGLEFNSNNYLTALAYYSAEEKVSYTFTYTFKGTALASPIIGTITMNGSATENVISISSNSNGTITINSITYNDEFDEGTKQEVIFDAATGEKVSENS